VLLTECGRHDIRTKEEKKGLLSIEVEFGLRGGIKKGVLMSRRLRVESLIKKRRESRRLRSVGEGAKSQGLHSETRNV